MGRSSTTNGERIKQLRLHKGWNVKRLSEVTGLSIQTIRRAERCDNIDNDSILLIAEAFGVTWRYLVMSYEASGPNQGDGGNATAIATSMEDLSIEFVDGLHKKDLEQAVERLEKRIGNIESMLRKLLGLDNES